MICDLIDLLQEFGRMGIEWQNKKNYCLKKLAYLQSNYNKSTQNITLSCNDSTTATHYTIIPTISNTKPTISKNPEVSKIDVDPVNAKPTEAKKITKFEEEYYTTIEKAKKVIESSIHKLEQKNKQNGRETIVKALQMLEGLAE